MRSMQRTLAAAAFALAFSCAVAAQDEPSWRGTVDENGLRRAEAIGRAKLGEAEVPARLELTCTTGQGGAVTWTLKLAPKAALAGFDFDAFEGPDAATGDRALARLELDGGVLRTGFDTRVDGFVPGADAFAFAFAAPANSASQAGLLAEAVDATTRAIRWTVRAPDDSGRAIVASIPAGGAAPVLRETMMGCGPVPPIDAARAASWRGRNPAASGLFEDRAIEWRLKGVLGAGYDAVRERLRKAEPAAVDGDVLYVLAPGDDASGVAVLFGLDSGDTEVIAIDAGIVTRRDADERALPVPGAVREFVAQRRSQ
jgi:hypothetical protein